MQNLSAIFKQANTVCLKMGSSRVVDLETLTPQEAFITSVGMDIATHLKGKRNQVTASGAVALGRKDAGFTADQELSPQEKQLAFGFGHQHHTALFQRCFYMAGLKPAAGHLVAPHNFDSDEQKNNLISSFNGLFDRGATIIANENDLTAIDELKPGKDNIWGDNDMLSARVSSVLKADLLIILTDVDGVYTDHPDNGGIHIPVLHQIDNEILSMAEGKGSAISTGGMLSKLVAAQMAQENGVTTIITKGDTAPISALLDGTQKCTIIPAFGR